MQKKETSGGGVVQGAGDLHTLTPTPSLALTYRKLDRHVEAVELHEALVVGRRQNYCDAVSSGDCGY